LTTVTIFINEDSLAAVERHLDGLEHLIAQYGARAFFGEPDAEPPRRSARPEVAGKPQQNLPDTSGE
jgi:hypothetical protein